MDISKTKLQLYKGLSQRKRRLEHALFTAEGAKCVGETLPFFTLEALVRSADYEVPSGVPGERVYEASGRELAQISSLSTPPKVIAVYRLPELSVPAPEELKGKLTLMLDGVQDPGNLGTIMRVADWFGVRQIIASPDTCDIFNPKAVQATMGAIGRVHICYTPLLPYLHECAALSIPVFGTLLEGQNIYEASLGAEGIIIMGNEGSGISAPLRPLIASPLFIPSYPAGAPTVESLNVAMATGITLSEFRRRSNV